MPSRVIYFASLIFVRVVCEPILDFHVACIRGYYAREHFSTLLVGIILPRACWANIMVSHDVHILPELWVKVLSHSINFLIENPPSDVVGIPQSAWLGEHDVASMQSATNFVQYCTEHYDEWALEMSALANIDVNDPQLVEISTTQFWDIFLQFYHEMWLLADAGERDERALRHKVCVYM